MWELTHLGSGDLVVEVGAYFWWEERKDLREEVEEDRIKALVWQMFVVWEGKLAVVILIVLTQGAGEITVRHWDGYRASM